MAEVFLIASDKAERAALTELLVQSRHNAAGGEKADLILACPATAEDRTAAEAAKDRLKVPLLMISPEAQRGPFVDELFQKPVRWAVLAARLAAWVAHAAEDTDSFAVGPLLCEPLERALYNAEGDEVARLTDKELKLLSVLAGADGAVVGREALLEAVWGYKAQLDTHTLETHIYRLRQKVEADPAAPLVLLTADGGYRLEGAS